MVSSDSPLYYERQGNIHLYRPKILTLPKGNRLFIRSLLFFFTTFKLLLTRNDLLKFDLIHSHMAVPSGFAGALLSKIFRKPIVVTCHGSDVNIYAQLPILRQMVKYSLHHCNIVVTVSEDLKEKVKALGIKYNKIKVLRNGVNAKIFKIFDKNKTRKQLALTNKKHIILYIGHLTQGKGLRFLLHSINHLLKINRQIYLFIIGEGEEQKSLSQMIKALGIERKVFLIGPLPNHEIPKWLGACDLLCLPSLSEGLPCVILEALACGRPVVATNVGGIPEILGDDETLGIMVPPEDDMALAKALIRALNTRWDPQQLSQKVSSWSWANIGEEYTRLFETLLDINR
jgi:glycosyltransferase involved in cell wall biosynthesis